MPWKYQDTLCVACEMCESDETMDHFMYCKLYSSSDYRDRRNIFLNDKESQFEAGLAVQKRQNERENILYKQEICWVFDSDSTAPGGCRAPL